MTALKQNLESIEWASPPSETIFRLIYQKEINLKKFREKIELDKNEFAALIHDNLTITPKLAYLLADTLGGSENFWMNRYKEFNDQLDSLNQIIYKENREILDNLSRTRDTNIDELLNSFKVSSFESLVIDYFHSPSIMYSRSQKMEPSPTKLANWIRNCEIIAENLIFENSVAIFDSERLNNEIGEILALSKVNSVVKAIPKLKSLLLNCGIVLIVSPSEVGLGVSGFTKPLLKKYRLITITDRYKNNAAFWFTLLHELAHCILHRVDKAIIHYSDNEFVLASDSTVNVFLEEEANLFVEELLFTEDLKNAMNGNVRSYKDIMRLGVKYDISTSLIVAQLHRSKLFPYSYFRKVYRKVKFHEIY